MKTVVSLAVTMALLAVACLPTQARPEPPSPFGGYPDHGDDGHHHHEDADEPSDAYGAPFGGMTTYEAHPMGSPMNADKYRMPPSSQYGAPKGRGSQGPQGPQGLQGPQGRGGHHHGPSSHGGKGKSLFRQQGAAQGHAHDHVQGFEGPSGHGSQRNMDGQFAGYGAASADQGPYPASGSGHGFGSFSGHGSDFSNHGALAKKNSYPPGPGASGHDGQASQKHGPGFSGRDSGSFSGYGSGPASGKMSRFGGQPSAMYGAPGAGSGYNYGRNGVQDDDDMAEDAMYQFEYSVGGAADRRADDADVPQFGQHEEREGEVTRGSYHVLLPDGRLQRVDYEADEHGFRPTVSFEDKRGANGPNGPNGPNGGPY